MATTTAKPNAIFTAAGSPSTVRTTGRLQIGLSERSLFTVTRVTCSARQIASRASATSHWCALTTRQRERRLSRHNPYTCLLYTSRCV